MLDLGWLYATWPSADEIESDQTSVRPWNGFPVFEELADRYAASTGRSLKDVKWFSVLGCFKLGAILEGSHARACAGKAPKEIGDRLHASTIRLFNRAHGLIAS
jgi:aminoglycoside phosphotransferase (APT) family kinase protein